MDFSQNNFTQDIYNAVIDAVFFEQNITYVTVSYEDCVRCTRQEQTVTLVVGENTIITNTIGNPVSASNLQVGMRINAIISSAMTRSIPPQAQAFSIEIIQNAAPQNTVTGRILNRDIQNRFLTVGSPTSSVIRFFVPNNTPIFNASRRPISLSMLFPGMRVRIRHADFMTASIPPQTTALEIQVL